MEKNGNRLLDNKVVNKQISLDQIIKVADYLEDYKEKYDKKFEIEENKNKDIPFGEKITLRVGYLVADETIQEPLLGVAIRRIDNEYICGINTKLDNVSIPWKKGYNEVTLTYPSFNLVGGEYYFDVGIFDKTGIVNLDYKARIKNFFVKTSSPSCSVYITSNIPSVR